MTSPSNPLITLPLTEYLDLAIGGAKEFAIVSIERAKEIELVDPSNSLLYIEDYGQLNLRRLWRIKDWHRSTQRAERVKVASEARVEAHNAREERIVRMMEELGMDRETSERIVSSGKDKLLL